MRLASFFISEQSSEDFLSDTSFFTTNTTSFEENAGLFFLKTSLNTLFILFLLTELADAFLPTDTPRRGKPRELGFT